MAKRIEAALNQGRNGYYLYEHISFCDPVNYGVEEPLQYISGDKEKMVVYHFVNRMTGYDIREMENRNGKFYTPDGEEKHIGQDAEHKRRFKRPPVIK